jgi:hypothetical protein
MKMRIKNFVNRFGLTFFVVCVVFFLAVGCATINDPLAGWTYRGFVDYLPSLQQHHYHLDQVITDDYQDFITKKKLSAHPVTGFYEDGFGQHAVEFTAFPPDQNVSCQYVLIYNKDNKRIKIIRYGRIQYQS